MSARYILAKYIPNLSRMESKNIGIFVWLDGAVRSMFLEPRDADFIQDKSTYKRWVAYWKRLTSSKDLKIPGRSEVPIHEPSYLDELIYTKEGNYILVKGGFVNEKVNESDLDDLTNFLFSELVANFKEIKPAYALRQAPSFKDRCNSVIKMSRLNGEYRERFKVKCELYGHPMHFKFDYGTGNGKPWNLFQRVSLRNEPSVSDATLKMQAIIGARILPKNRCAVLLESPDDSAKDDVRENYELVSDLFTVIDIRDEEKAIFEINRVALSK